MSSIRHLAAPLAVGAALSFALRALFVKLSGSEVSLWQLLFLQAVLGLPVLWLFSQSLGVPLRPHPGQSRAYLGRLFFGIANSLLLFWALLLAPAGIATLLGCTAPLFLAMLAPFMLGERSTLPMLALVVAAFGGIAVAATGSAADLSLLSLMVGLGSGLASAFAQVYSRRLALANEHSLRIVFWLNVATAVCSAAAVTATHGWTLDAKDYVAGFVIALCSVGGQVLTAMAYARGSALVVNALSYLVLPAAAALGWLVLAEPQSVEGWLGMAATIAATASLVVLEQRQLQARHRVEGPPTPAQLHEEATAVQQSLGAEAQPLFDVDEVESGQLGPDLSAPRATGGDTGPAISTVSPGLRACG